MAVKFAKTHSEKLTSCLWRHCQHDVNETSDAFILDTVQLFHIEFKRGSSGDQHNVRVQRFNNTEETIIDVEILRLCEKGVLQEITHCKYTNTS